MPLIKNPSFQPPKPVTLNANYSKLLPTLTNSIKPPKLNLKAEDLDNWVKDLESLKDDMFDIKKYDKDVDDYNQWLKKKQLQMAPGFDSGVIMKPQKVEKSSPQQTPTKSAVNELDEVFGKTSINE